MNREAQASPRRRVPAALFLAAVLAFCCLAGCQAQTKNEMEPAVATKVPGVLTVASDLVSPPMNYINEDEGVEAGFEVDLIEAVAARLGLAVNYVDPMAFEDIDDAVAGGDVDLGVSAITGRDFDGSSLPLVPSSTYMDSGRSLIMQMDAEFTSLDELNNEDVDVAVQQGSPNEAWVRQNLPKAKVRYVPEATVGLINVANGTYECAVYDTVTANYLINVVFSSVKVVYDEPDSERYCFMASEDNKELVEGVDKALAELEADGTVESLEVKWFGEVIS